jgi:pimeloyl-ACP methyl ester carboxylesterase
MTTRTTTATPAGAGADRYRQTEAALWRHHGIDPRERFVQLRAPDCRLRVLDVGAGEPLLFVHGTIGPGGWPSLVQTLPGYRCLLLDRPGWGGSDPVDFGRQPYATAVADIVRGLLDTLDVDSATLVGGSIGNVWAVRAAERHPERVRRVVMFGGSPLVPQVGVPGFVRLIASPVGALMVRLPMSPERVRGILTDSGHGPAVADGRLPEQFVQWRASASQTGAMRHERDMVRAIVRGSSYRPGLTFTDAELSAIRTPALCVFGTADPTGSVDIWQHVMDTMPDGRLEVVAGAGHLPWFDDIEHVTTALRNFLRS